MAYGKKKPKKMMGGGKVKKMMGGGKVMKYKNGGMTEEEKKKKIKKVFAEMKSDKSKIKNPKQAIAIALNSKKKDKKKDKKKGTKNV
jgi:hypothetical protein